MRSFFLSVVIFLSTGSTLASGWRSCGESLQGVSMEDPSYPSTFRFSREDVQARLTEVPFNAQALIEVLSQDPFIKELFLADAGVFEKYSIEIHTKMVFSTFFEQKPFLGWDSVKGTFPEIERILLLSIAVHDIGKPLAIARGDKSAQHAYTVPIAQKIFRYLGLSENETRLALTLIGNDIFGDLVKGKINLTVAREQLQKLASENTLSYRDFARLQGLFYIIDAGSYPYLRAKIFRPGEEKLILLSSDFYHAQD